MAVVVISHFLAFFFFKLVAAALSVILKQFLAFHVFLPLALITTTSSQEPS